MIHLVALLLFCLGIVVMVTWLTIKSREDAIRLDELEKRQEAERRALLRGIELVRKDVLNKARETPK